MKESLRQGTSPPKASPPTHLASSDPLPTQSPLPPEMVFLQQQELLCCTASQGDFCWLSTISACAKTVLPATTQTVLQKITPTCHALYFPSCMGHPNPPKAFMFCYILSTEELIWKCKSAETCWDWISSVDKICCLHKSCHQPAWGLTGRVTQRTNRSQWLSPTINLGPVARLAHTRTNCTYLCSGDTPVEWQGLSAATSHGPPTASREGKAIYVRSPCCCPQQVGQLSKCLFQDKNSNWIPLAHDPYLPCSACPLCSPLPTGHGFK